MTLTAEERGELDWLISCGKADARKLAHARILLQADASEAGWPDAAIAAALRVSIQTIERVRQRFVDEGFSAALLPRPAAMGISLETRTCSPITGVPKRRQASR